MESIGCLVYGGQGDDPYLRGSHGNDKMYGNAGDDVYHIDRDSGVDEIFNYTDDYTWATDTVLFGADISTADLKLVHDGDDLMIDIDGNYSINDMVANPIADQTVKESEAISFAVSVNDFGSLVIKDWFRGDAYKLDQAQFADGTILSAAQLEALGIVAVTYNATLADGSVLPSWLTFDAATLTFSGTPTNEDAGILPVQVTAKDSTGASVSMNFNLTVESENDPPVVANTIADQSTMEDAGFNFTIPANTFSDVDMGDSLTYSAALADGCALPLWLSFDPETVTFSGTPGNDNVGVLSLKVTATDASGASTSDIFDVTVTNVNDQPVIANPLADQSTTEDAAFSFAIPVDTFMDADVGDTLTYSVTVADGSTLPSWLSFDPVAMTLSGMPGNDNVGIISLNVSATDASGVSASDVFDLTVINVNDPPDLANPIVDQSATEGAAFSFAIPVNTFMDADVGDTLTYSATLTDGAALPSWFNFNPSTMTFSGTPVEAGTLSVRVTATDSAGASASDVFNLDVQANLKITYGTNWPNIIFTSSDNDLIYALGGADLVYSGAGRDTLYGGDGLDLLCGDGGNDIVYGENDSDILFGGAGNDFLSGGNGTDILHGDNGNDTLDGGSGMDVMAGSSGDDTYVVDSACDIVVELCDDGTDTVMSAITYTLGSNVENLTLTGTSVINGTGNTLDNVLIGNSGNNTLNGGSGNDSYIFGKGGGTDIVTDSGSDASTQDLIRFQSDVLQDSIAIFQGTSDLAFAYGDTARITVTNQTSTSYGIEKVQLDNGLYMAAADINQLIQNMATFAVNHGLAFSGVDDVKASPDLMAMVSSSWHA